jgi:hypothetical protein
MISLELSLKPKGISITISCQRAQAANVKYINKRQTKTIEEANEDKKLILQLHLLSLPLTLHIATHLTSMEKACSNGQSTSSHDHLSTE